jgi:hypothetical protein
MNAYLTYDRIEDRRWVEQQLTDEKEKWIDDRAQQIIDMMPKSRPASSTSRSRLTPAHTKDFAAIKLARPTTISFRQLLTPRRNTTGNTVPAARFNLRD